MSGLLKDVNTQNFQQEVIEGDGLILVDFWAPWCGPCKMVTPVLEAIAKEMADQVTIMKVNVDDNSDLARTYGVAGIPTFILFKNGEIVARNVGAAPRQTIESLIRKHA
jgi:thioredoxin 1